MKVKATGEFEKHKVYPEELNYIPKAGTEFEVSEKRYEILQGKNFYKVKFVEPVKEIEVAKKEAKTEKAVKKTTKKVK